jgi:hypothetical protein
MLRKAASVTARRAVMAVLALLPLGLRAAGPDVLLARVRGRLADAPVLRGQFEQRKTIKGFRNPLLSSGDFVLARTHGVIWHTRKPFESTLVLTRGRLLARQADGSVTNQLDATREPGLRAINEMLLALMAADLAALEQRFRIGGEMRDPGWQLTLTPRDAALAQWLAGIELEGDRHVNTVRLAEAGGDVSQIRFTRHEPGQALARDEEALLE